MTDYWKQNLAQRSNSPSYNPFLVPNLLCLFLQTVTLIISTIGPHSPQLSALTDQTISLLISLHSSPVSTEPTALAALLSLLLAVLDLNIASGTSGEERLVTEFASPVIELREWVGAVFENMPTGPTVPGANATTDPHERVRMLAAGVMVKLGEVIERYQGRLMGINSGLKY